MENIVIYLLNKNLLEQILDDLDLAHSRNLNDDIVIDVASQLGISKEMLPILSIENTSILKLSALFNKAIPKDEWGNYLILCNQFHAGSQYGRAYLSMEPGEQTAAFIFSSYLQLERGTTFQFLKTHINNCLASYSKITLAYVQHYSTQENLFTTYISPANLPPPTLEQLTQIVKGIKFKHGVTASYTTNKKGAVVLSLFGLGWPSLAHIFHTNRSSTLILFFVNTFIPPSKWPDAIIICNKLNLQIKLGNLSLSAPEQNYPEAVVVFTGHIPLHKGFTYEFIQERIQEVMDEAISLIDRIHTEHQLF
jgi:hypothetical protein